MALHVKNLALALSAATTLSALGVAAEPQAPAAADRESSRPAYRTRSLRGRVVWLAEALQEKYGIESDRDAVHSSVALETDDGRLLPIVKDFRGRGFFADERLRDTPLELLARTFEGSPVIQVVRVYAIKDDGKYELDYWCDICSIPMYELKDCECCQGPTRIRLRLAEESDASGSDSKQGEN